VSRDPAVSPTPAGPVRSEVEVGDLPLELLYWIIQSGWVPSLPMESQGSEAEQEQHTDDSECGSRGQISLALFRYPE
jgi:hypothetical protein